MWTQIVGKATLALAPAINHWWGITMRVSARGLATALVPSGERAVQFEFDFRRHALTIDTTDGGHKEIRLEPRSVADFYSEFRAHIDELGVEIDMIASPTEVVEAIPFAEDETHASYDAASAHAFWLMLVNGDRVLSEFRSRFIGKCSPVHVFWGSLDLACTRFSGRTAPRHAGGVPNCPDWVQQEAYSHEVCSAGFWPGGDGEGVFYSYAYPQPAGFEKARVEPAAASYDASLGEFVLPYSDVRASKDPDATLLSFLQSAYEAAAHLAMWDRTALER
jgi:hypothetical protein